MARSNGGSALPRLLGEVQGVDDVTSGAAQKPDAAFKAAGQNRTLRIVLQIVGTFLRGIGRIASGISFLVIRPKVTVAPAPHGRLEGSARMPA